MSRPVNKAGSARAWIGVLALATLAGCSDPHGELQAWMDKERQQARPHVPPLVPPRKFDPQPYVSDQLIDPFSGQKLAVAIKQESREPNSLLAAEMNRRREPLEAYPLDTLFMVGSVQRAGRPYALMKADNLLYQVKVGDYLGQNYGRITRITETEVTLREIVQDASGDWVERVTTLSLQERPPQGKGQ